jgi:hypothetical protein
MRKTFKAVFGISSFSFQIMNGPEKTRDRSNMITRDARRHLSVIWGPNGRHTFKYLWNVIKKEPSTSQTVEGSTGYSTDSTNTATHGDFNEKTDLNLKNKRDELSNAEANIKMEPRSNHKDSSRLFSYMFMVISLSFILSYIPQIFLLYSLFRDRYFWIKSSHQETIVYKFLDQMVMINNIVNPFVYGFFDKKFRSAAKALIHF